MLIITPVIQNIQAKKNQENECPHKVDLITSEDSTNSNKEPFKFQSNFEGVDELNNKGKIEISVQGNIETETPTFHIGNEKLIITKYHNDHTTVSLFLKSSTGKIPEIDVIPTDFFISSKAVSSIASDQFTPTINHKLVKETSPSNGNGCELQITDETNVDNFGKYTGKFIIIADGYESKEIAVEYQIQHHPIWLIVFSSIGIGIRVGTTVLLHGSNEKDKKIKKLEKNIGIIDHLNRHVDTIKKTVYKTDVKGYIENFNERQIARINVYSDNNEFVNLKEVDSEVLEDILKHYEIFEDQIKSYFDEKGEKPEISYFPTHDGSLENKKRDIVKNAKKDAGKKDEKIKKIREQIDKNDETEKLIELQIQYNALSHNPLHPNAGESVFVTIISIVLSLIVSVPASLFAISYFPGNPVLDAVVAIGIGFSVYETKEIGKKLKKIVE